MHTFHKYLTFKPELSQNGRFQKKMCRRDLSSENGSLPFKTGELEHIHVSFLAFLA